MSQATIARGRRMSTARCYLDPIRNRQNLHIETHALTEALVIDGKRCTGVHYSVGGEAREAAAAREVVVCGGTINSPQLLELSGIGQPERLQKLGIEVRQALPGVGENLRDHFAPRTRWLVGKKGVTFNDRARGLGMVHQALRYALFRKGFLASVGAPMRAFVCSREGLEAPDLLLGWVPMLTEPGPKGRGSPNSPALPATHTRCGRKARGISTSPRPIRTGRPRSTSTFCRRRPMRS